MKTIILTTCMLLLTSACFAQEAVSSGQKPVSAIVVNDSNAFAADLYAKLAADKKGNLFFSPSSIHSALAMTYAGAAGNTADQMAKTLHFTLPPDKLNPAFVELLKMLNSPPQNEGFEDDSGKQIPVYQLVVANALWGQKGYAFKPDFTQLLQKSYGAGLNDVDFAKADEAAKTINDWVAQQTKDKIKDLIPKGVLNDQTRLVLTNAIYFKSDWQNKFSKDDTKNDPFSLSANKTVDVPMMHIKKAFAYAENDDLQMIELPYLHDNLSMLILLPKKAEGLAGIEEKFSMAQIEKVIDQRKLAEVTISMPKFRFSTQFNLSDTLAGMGMADAFTPDKADFSGMTAKEKVFIGAVVHGAFVSVDEDGTEAGGAAISTLYGGSMPRKVFKADHPFAFMIRHNSTGAILFMGRVANPKTE